ncbi:DUF72 domain-containing protein [soil metagenome]
MTADQLDIFGGGAEAAATRFTRDELPVAAGESPGLLLGCCAWQHPSFVEHFYPRGLATNKQLGYYAQHFNSVEIDASFYRVPAPKTVARWADVTPPAFRFAMKAPRGVTHEGWLDLEDPRVRIEWDGMLAVLPHFGGKLSTLLIQLGPRITITLKNRLARLLETVPPEVSVAVEFRHPSWLHQDVDALLAAHRVARVWADHYLDPSRKVTEDNPHLLAETAPTRYVRLLGDTSTKFSKESGERLFQYGPNLLFDRTADLARWCARIKEQRQRFIKMHVYINNHYSGYSPFTIERIREAMDSCEVR